MKYINSWIKKYGYNISVFLLLTFALTLSYIRYYMNDVFPLSGDGILEISFLSFVKESLKNGEWPLWNKYLSAGMPLAGNISMHSFYLPAVILSFLPLKLYYYSYYILHVAVGAFFFFLLLKQIGCRKEIATVMSFVYLFSINLGGLRKNHLLIIVTSVYLPIIIYLIEKYLETEKYKWLAFAAFAMALQFCGGFVQCILYSDVFVGLYLVVGYLRRKRNWKKGLLDILKWLVTYFGLIAVQLLPFLELLQDNSKYNRTTYSYELFTSYSFHPIKLLQMIFPKIFVDVFASFGAYNSSGMDIEIYLGPVIIVLLICGMTLYRKEYRLKAYGIASILIFCWASIASFPMIAKVANKIPLLGSTRAQSRVIFIFVFLVLLMAGYISELIIRNKDYTEFFTKAKWLIGSIVLLVLVAFAGAFIFVGAGGFVDEECSLLTNYFNNSFAKDIVLYILCLLTFFMLKQSTAELNLKKGMLFLGALLAINLIAVLPYSLQSTETLVSETLGTDSVQDSFLKENVSEYKVWDDFAGISGAHQSSIAQNKSVIKKIAGINSYTNFANARLYMLLSASDNAPLNDSGMLTGNYLSKTNMLTRNDVLSMLGIKYIIDSEDCLGTDYVSYSCGGEKREIMSIDGVEGVETEENTFVAAYDIPMKPNLFYKVEFKGSAVNNENFYIDFCGEEYDSADQQRDSVLTNQEKEYEYIIFSGEGVPNETVLRFVCADVHSDISITDVRVTEMETYRTEPYRLANSDGEYNIYENLNANNILYFSNVINMPEGFDIYRAVGLNLGENSYIEDGIELKNISADKTITDIDFGINTIKASVYADEESFVNFSQTYYPGWKVYVDGMKQEMYLVNGVIMGTYISPGNHVLEFRYEPASVMAGAAISLLTLLVLVLFGGMKRKLMTATYKEKLLH